ncbi:MAG: GTP 3',8-cyclase MoaA [Parvularculaceae bacterium]
MARTDTQSAAAPLADPFGRAISYLRLSVTDRCDLRCAYCMPEDTKFLPRAEILSLEELDAVASAFIRLGVDKIRITGGEPLTRRNVTSLFESLSRHLYSGALREITLTTNGTLLSRFAERLAEIGVRRINVSLDSLDGARFARISRRGALLAVLEGLEAARQAGLAVKINTVALKGENEEEIPSIISWAHDKGFDVTLIEVMPMGEVYSDRTDQYLPLSVMRERLEERWTLDPIAHRTGGPARYVRIRETGGRLGFITPLTNNFCEGCNRVRVTCKGELFMCLGQNDRADLKTVLRENPDPEALVCAIREAIAHKPKGHDFRIEKQAAPAVARRMSVTGG